MRNATAVLKYARMSAKKLKCLARSLKGKSATTAILQTQRIQNKASRMISKLIRTAVANAETGNQRLTSGLIIESISVTDGPVIKRYIPAARGSAHPIRKCMSHIKIILKLDNED